MPDVSPLHHHSGPQSPFDQHFRYPLSIVIKYAPSSELIGYNWETAEDVLTHLLQHPRERDAIRAEAQRRSPDSLAIYHVWHPLLAYQLVVNSFNTDFAFVQTIERLILRLEWQNTVVNPPLRLVRYHPPSLSSLDPFCYKQGLWPPLKMTTPLPPSPCQIILGPNGTSIVPLFKNTP
jgi:hypothetical protein